MVGDGHDAPQAPSQSLAGSAGGDIIGITGDPEPSHPMLAGERKEQSAGALGVVPSPRRRVHVVAEVAVVHFDFVSFADP